MIDLSFPTGAVTAVEVRIPREDMKDPASVEARVRQEAATILAKAIAGSMAITPLEDLGDYPRIRCEVTVIAPGLGNFDPYVDQLKERELEGRAQGFREAMRFVENTPLPSDAVKTFLRTQMGRAARELEKALTKDGNYDGR